MIRAIVLGTTLLMFAGSAIRPAIADDFICDSDGAHRAAGKLIPDNRPKICDVNGNNCHAACSQEACPDDAYMAQTKWAYSIYREADKMPDATPQQACEKEAFLYWANFFRDQAGSYHDIWLQEKNALKSFAPPPANLGK